MAFPGQFSYFEVLREERNDYHTAADNQAVPEKNNYIHIQKRERRCQIWPRATRSRYLKVAFGNLDGKIENVLTLKSDLVMIQSTTKQAKSYIFGDK